MIGHYLIMFQEPQLRPYYQRQRTKMEKEQPYNRLMELLEECRNGNGKTVGLFDILEIERLAQLAQTKVELGEYDILSDRKSKEQVGDGSEGKNTGKLKLSPGIEKPFESPLE